MSIKYPAPGFELTTPRLRVSTPGLPTSSLASTLTQINQTGFNVRLVLIVIFKKIGPFPASFCSLFSCF